MLLPQGLSLDVTVYFKFVLFVYFHSVKNIIINIKNVYLIMYYLVRNDVFFMV